MRLVGTRIPPPKYKTGDVVKCYYNHYILRVVSSKYIEDQHIYILTIIGESRTGVSMFIGWKISYTEEQIYKG